jgi:Lrp/AsnC family leucine-responsive transcriptional regulator
MDETNLQLLHLLQKNGRASVAELAVAVSRSESTVRERITALELGGFLQGYQARVDWSLIGLPARAIIRARCDLNRVTEATRQLASIPNVTRAVVLTGPKPILAIMQVRDLQHLHSLLRDHLGSVLTDIEAEISLQTLVDDRFPSMLDVAALPARQGTPGTYAPPPPPTPPAV